METILAVEQPKRKTTLDPSFSTRLEELTLQEFDALALEKDDHKTIYLTYILRMIYFHFIA